MITLTLSDEQLQTLAGLLDAGVRASGLRAAKGAAELLELIEQASREAEEASDEH